MSKFCGKHLRKSSIFCWWLDGGWMVVVGCVCFLHTPISELTVYPSYTRPSDSLRSEIYFWKIVFRCIFFPPGYIFFVCIFFSDEVETHSITRFKSLYFFSWRWKLTQPLVFKVCIFFFTGVKKKYSVFTHSLDFDQKCHKSVLYPGKKKILYLWVR